MTDPYEILNISSTATDDEVKKAYRELARKYHPDNYHDNPLADLAQEKMKGQGGAAAEPDRGPQRGVELPHGYHLLPPGLGGRGPALLPDRLPDGPR